MEDQGWRDRGSRIHSAFLPWSFRRGHLQAAWQIHSRRPPDLHAWWLRHCSHYWLSDPGQENKDTATQQVWCFGACQGGKSHVPPGTWTAFRGCDPPVSAGPSPSLGARSPWAELILPRKKKPRAEEKVMRPNPHLQPPWCHDLAAACRQRFPGSCSVWRRSSPNPPIHDTTSQQGGFKTIFKTFRTSIEEPEPLP